MDGRGVGRRRVRAIHGFEDDDDRGHGGRIVEWLPRRVLRFLVRLRLVEATDAPRRGGRGR